MLRRLFKKKPKLERVKSTAVSTAGFMMPTKKSPDETYADLFNDVQDAQVYPDGKTFVDLVPRKRSTALSKEYKLERLDPDFNINEFINRHFYEFNPHRGEAYTPDSHTTAREHVSALWKELTRRNRKVRGSLIPLPNPYIVPGGRFSEQFYWDSYFIMLGLSVDNEWSMIRGMIKNYSHMLLKFGMIPTANRTYFLSRSQPPFFSHMVKLLAQHQGRTRTYAEFLPSMIIEYRFWMKGRRIASEHIDRPAYARVVRMPNGVTLNRYFDNKTTPRPESRREDVETAAHAVTNNKDKIFLDLRAGAESGWDFSSRWFKDADKIESIHTTDMVPVDLNCLLYTYEQTIAEAYALIKQPMLARRFRLAAERRAETILRYCWNPHQQFFCDYDFRLGVNNGRLTLAGIFPLYAKIASSEQAAAVARRIEQDFLYEGGLVSTLIESGQQWDSPNGWAPLQWVAIGGLRAYGYHELANTIRDRWLKVNEQVFMDRRKMIEKYDVKNPGTLGGGGEYPLQDGFGWTNGVYAVLKDETTS